MSHEVKQSVLVKNTLYEVMNSCFQRNAMRGATTRILALIAFNDIGVEQGISTLKQLNNNAYFTRIYADEEYFTSGRLHHFFELSGNDDWTILNHSIGEIEDDYDQIFIPVASFSLVSELVHFLGNRPLAKVIQRALLKGKKVTMLELAVNPYSKTIIEGNWDKGTSFMKAELFNQLKRLQGFGVTLIHSNEVKSHFQRQTSGKRLLLAEKEVISARQKQKKEIMVSPGTLVTPLARDTAKELGIRLTIK
ncbi:hypothetical protein D1B31_07720 [Neobacillus notoginsengisoli]|uniref:Ethanolamine utilization protein n=1 Tax=Neobacillus notoginsengisoli TaxID=1578198 RepID=A0A417YW62_9BACI|nr:hypothetical protein [Neobacillus notoginsengisoli]RHW41595.1 hypothetical protein D1B31_07720 [Neobacillus notoginsengisoli]